MPINRVGSKGIEDGAVATADLADNVITSAKLGDGQVTNAKLANTTITLAGQSITLGGSVSFANKFVDWQSVITAAGGSNTAVSGKGYFIDTTSAAHTLTLPASASRGDFIAIKDYAGTFATNNLTVGRNGHNIQGAANDSLITNNRASLVLVYVDSTKGWLYWEEHNVADLQAAAFISATGGTVTESGNFKIHTFTGDGCFVVSCGGNPLGSNTVDYLVVAGGGGGGAGGSGGGGGGAGGFRESHSTPVSGCYTASPLATPTGITVSATTYPITVGSGGSGGTVVHPCGSPQTLSTAGSNSIFSTITSTGGGRGGDAFPTGAPNSTGGSGGSGGGGTENGPTFYPGGSGNTPPTSPSQGFGGGNAGPAGGGGGSGGGGGATQAGTTISPSAPANGGNGATTSISGSPTSYAGGGGGGSHTACNWGTGGTGGGGNAAPNAPYPPFIPGFAGTTNSGGGGGGGTARGNAQYLPAGNGGKGIVIIRYKYQ